MRISTSMMMNSYSQTLNDELGNIDKYSNQVSSSRKFNRPSDDPIDAMQSLQACHDYSENQQDQTSDNSATSWMQATESTINQMNSILQSAQEKATEAVNGTNNATDLQNLGEAMQSYRDEMVTTLNSSFNGSYIFGKSTSGQPPFKLGTAADDGAANDGKLMYYNYNAKDASGNPDPAYVAVDTITQSSVDGMKLSMPIDLGMGVQVSGGQVNPNSVFDAATSGLDAIISGFSGTGGTATNIVDDLTSAVSDLSTNNIAGLSPLISNVEDAQNAVLKTDVGIGEKSKMLTFMGTKLTDDQSNIENRLSNSLDTDTTQAIMQYNISQTVYKESMSISSTVLQQSLIDFLK
jgi:flagellar hook-associated protein 3 FlgL